MAKEKTIDMDLLGKRSEENKFLNIKEFNGQLYMVRILMFYDYPRFFVCQNENDELYLFIETRDEKEYEAWGVIKINYDDLIKFYKNKLSFRDLYIIYNDSYWDVINYYSEKGFNITIKKNKPTELLDFYKEEDNFCYDAPIIDPYFDKNLYDSIGD